MSILEDTEADDYQIYLTGEGNFREEVAVTLPYKGNRDELHKPTHYTAIKQYLIDVWQAETVEGMEADDAMGIEQYKDLVYVDGYGYVNPIDSAASPALAETIICTLDKDLDMIPGWHYNWRKKTKYWIDEEQAMRNFYKQMLMGDRTDNIQGVPKIGEKTAEKILATCTNEKEMFDAVQEQYYLGYYKYGSHSSIDDFLNTIDDIFLEHALLIWINRHPTKELPEEFTQWMTKTA